MCVHMLDGRTGLVCIHSTCNRVVVVGGKVDRVENNKSSDGSVCDFDLEKINFKKCFNRKNKNEISIDTECISGVWNYSLLTEGGVYVNTYELHGGWRTRDCHLLSGVFYIT